MADTQTGASPSKCCDFTAVLREEYVAVHGWLVDDGMKAAGLQEPDPEKAANDAAEKSADELRHMMFRKETSALCLSGGGIRSASFCLGAVQSLARGGFLRNFHYLSTVSGGGYTGSMLAAWGYRAAPDYAEIEKGLTGDKAKVDPVRWLRDFTSFLAPRYGLLSIDTWTLFSTYLRNLLLNWLMLVPLCCAVFLLPHLVVSLATSLVNLPSSTTAIEIADDTLLVGVLFSFIAVILWRSTSSLLGDAALRSARMPAWIAACSLVAAAFICCSGYIIQARGFDHQWTASLRPLAQLGAYLLASALELLPSHLVEWVPWLNPQLRVTGPDVPWLRLPLAYGALGLASWLCLRLIGVLQSNKPPVRNWDALLVAFVVTGAATGFALHGWHEVLVARIDQATVARYYWTFGPPAVGVAFALAEILLIGLVSKQTDDFDREWWARMGARLLTVGGGWMALFAIALLVPAAVRTLDLTRATWLPSALSTGVILIGAIIARIAFRRTQSPSAGAAAAAGGKGDLALNVAAAAFLLLFLSGVSVALEALLRMVSSPAAAAAAFGYRYEWRAVVTLIALTAIALWIAPSYIHINRFSLHAMYRERLIRAFLGGTRIPRTPPADLDDPGKEPNQYRARVGDIFTKFDRHDNPALWWLDPRRRPPMTPPDKGKGDAKSPPFQIVNCALNLSGSERLSLQERQAASFSFTPLHCGSPETGYRRSPDYAGEVGGVTLGTALTISGAAVSPNAGQHSSPILTAVLTLFNARLGSWLGNPSNDDTSVKQGPTYALGPLVRELFGKTDECSAWVHLSDGGHFDNLGIYEPVRRGCRYIVAIDASADPDRKFTDLGNAIRKIRLDLEVDVDLKSAWLIGGVERAANGRYCALFTIRYKGLPAKPLGSLLYVKPSIYRYDRNPLPMDVLEYSGSSPAFPHESTVDQFFTESQFESYRALGEHELDMIAKACSVPGDISELFEAAPIYIEGAASESGGAERILPTGNLPGASASKQGG